jgi:transcriptional regulator with XRE-family HTH domain
MYKKYAQLRDERDLTDYQVAVRAGIPQSSLYDWKQRSEKREDATISVNALAKIAAVLEVKVDDLIA